jgi:hypothetical protein
MYFWKIDALKIAIRNNQLTETNRFVYALIFFILNSIVMEFSLFVSIEYTLPWNLAISIANFMVVLLGTLYTFRANGASMGG